MMVVISRLHNLREILNKMALIPPAQINIQKILEEHVNSMKAQAQANASSQL